MLHSEEIRVGMLVKHSRYGIGEIKEVTDNTVTVSYDDENWGTKGHPRSLAKAILSRLTEADLKQRKRPLQQMHLDKASNISNTDHDDSAVNEQMRARSRAWVKRVMSGTDPNDPWYDPYRSQETGYKSTMNPSGIHIKPFHSVEAFCDEFEADLQDEIDYVKKNGGTKHQLTDGKLVDGSHYSYCYESDVELHIPYNSSIRIWISDHEWQPGTIISCEEYTVVFNTQYSLGDPPKDVSISSAPWQLIDNLKEHISKFRDRVTPLVRKLICEGFYQIDGGTPIIRGQERANAMATEQDISFIWGPPGTGKTTTLVQIAADCMARDKRVLMVSYSNVAVDDASLRFYNYYNDKYGAIPGSILRYGYPRKQEVIEHPILSSFNMAIRSNPELYEEYNRLKRRTRNLRRDTEEYIRLQTRISEIRSYFSETEHRLVHHAGFVATTVAKAVSDITIYNQQFDTVLFDEASMAYVPQVIFSASLAKNHFVCLGDFCQLPPIVQSGDDSSLNSDIFQYCGIQAAIENKWSHKWLCLLDIQHRMHPDIADFVNNGMYFGLLISGDELIGDPMRRDIRDHEPAIDYSLGMSDISSFNACCHRTADFSHYNIFSAMISYANAIKSIEPSEKRTAGIITPYNVQARLINAMIHDTWEDTKEWRIHSATVHQFQGSEQNVIIYDAVDSYPLRQPGGLLTKTKNNIANRLFNVAVSRAQGKFIMVVDRDYITSRSIKGNNMFHRYSLCSGVNPKEMEKEEAFPDRLPEYARIQILDKDEAELFLEEDISNAKHDIAFDIEDVALIRKSPVIRKALQEIGKGSDNIDARVRVLNRSSVERIYKGTVIERQYIRENLLIIDRRIVWYFPALTSQDEDKSIGDVADTSYFRFEGRYTGRMIYNLLKMGYGKKEYSEAE